MNWLDIAVLLILLVNIGLGLFRGLIKSVTNLISIILGFIAAKMYYMEVYDFLIEKYDLLNTIKITVANTFSSIKFPEISQMSTLSSEELSKSIGDSDYSTIVIEKFFESDFFDDLLNKNVQNFSEGFSIWLSENILTILSMVLVFLIVLIGIRLVGFALDKVFKLPVLNGVNRLSGFIFGLVKGCFFAMLFVLLIVIIGPLFSNFDLIRTLEHSSIAIYFYKYNIVMYIFEQFM